MQQSVFGRSFIYLLLFFLLSPTLTAQKWTITEPIRFLALGDSYTIGQGVNAELRWPEQLMDSLQARGFAFDTLQVIATTGWTTQNLQNAINGMGLAEKDFNMVSLLIGVNDQFQGQPISLYPFRLERLIDSALHFLGQDTSRLFMLSIPDYAYTPFGQTLNPAQISLEIDQYNDINQAVAEAYGIRYFNITPISRQGLNDPSLVANDNLHPSGKQYSQWVELMMEYVDSVYNSPTSLQTPALSGLKVYPNPTTRLLRVEWDSPKEATIQLFSLNGQALGSEQTGIGKATLVLDLPQGVYHLILRSQGKQVAKPVVVLGK